MQELHDRDCARAAHMSEKKRKRASIAASAHIRLDHPRQ